MRRYVFEFILVVYLSLEFLCHLAETLEFGQARDYAVDTQAAARLAVGLVPWLNGRWDLVLASFTSQGKVRWRET